MNKRVLTDTRENTLRHFIKRFLNSSPKEHGTISICVETPKTPKDFRTYSEVEANLRLQDCSETIHLSFSFNSEEGYNKRLDKLDGMIDDLKEMRKEMVKQSKYLFKYKPKVMED